VHGARDSERLIGGKRHWSCYPNHKISHTCRISDFLRCYRHFQTVISQFPVQHSDQPVENGGDDSAMTPPELFLASLGSCAAFEFKLIPQGAATSA
jgi:hypothetical protein